MCKISIIMPVYNAEKYLELSIESILNQSFKDFEFIIINDGSTDSSLEIIKKWQRSDSRITLITRENRGLIFSLNEGLNLANGKFIARMDSDDISLPERLQLQYEYLESNDLDICGCHFEKVNENGESLGIEKVPVTKELIDLSLISQVPFAHPSVMMRRSFLQNNSINYGSSGFKNAEDLALWMELHSAGAKFGNVNEVLFKYRVLSSSLSSTNRNGLILDTRILTIKYYEKNKNSLQAIMDNYRVLNKDNSKLISHFVMMSIFRSFDWKYLVCLRKSSIKDIYKAFGREVKVMLGR